MAKHLKDKKISIMAVQDSGPMPGSGEIAPIPGGENIWAYYRQASAEEFYDAGLAGYKVEAIFEINWRDDIKNYMLIRYKGKDYNITRIDDFEGYKENLTIYAYKVE